ncbi:MAG: ABC transporter substrate-binding protein [Gammaproteobacteria bacterium]|nr:ABC transporter substrate-binding protein [Gammaproteobacteria bacterium]
MMCYSACPETARAWKNGWTMALEEINASGGVLGRPLEVISRDTRGDPSDALQVANDLVSRDQVVMLYGSLYDHVNLAMSNFARNHQILYFSPAGGTLKLTGEEWHDLYFQYQPPISGWIGPIVDKKEVSTANRWAVVSANYEFGRSLVDEFQTRMEQVNPDFEFVEKQWFPIFKLDAGSVAQVLSQTEVDGLFVLAFESDYVKFVREGRKRNLFENKVIVAPVGGHPGYIRQLGEEAPVGWWSTGYPVEQFNKPGLVSFREKYQSRYDGLPDMFAQFGYVTLHFITDAMEKTGSTDSHLVAEMLRTTTFDTLDGPLSFREFDGASSYGMWIGKTGFYDELPTIVDWEFVDPVPYLRSREELMKLRAAN